MTKTEDSPIILDTDTDGSLYSLEWNTGMPFDPKTPLLSLSDYMQFTVKVVQRGRSRELLTIFLSLCSKMCRWYTLMQFMLVGISTRLTRKQPKDQ